MVVNAENAALLEGLDLGDVTVVDVDSAAWQERVAAAGPLVPHAEVGAMDTFMMIFTSGTSGEPKAVQVPHVFPVFSGAHLVEQFAITAADAGPPSRAALACNSLAANGSAVN